MLFTFGISRPALSTACKYLSRTLEIAKVKSKACAIGVPTFVMFSTRLKVWEVFVLVLFCFDVGLERPVDGYWLASGGLLCLNRCATLITEHRAGTAKSSLHGHTLLSFFKRRCSCFVDIEFFEQLVYLLEITGFLLASN